MERTERSFIKNGKERKERNVLLKRTDAQPCIYAERPRKLKTVYCERPQLLWIDLSWYKKDENMFKLHTFIIIIGITEGAFLWYVYLKLHSIL